VQVQAIIPAAGAGLHQGESSAKVLLPVGGRSLIRRTLEAFDRCPEITGITLLISQRNLLEVTK
jgi:2-C-methyl-D-erythritol 4-phosphate cytidylyltransferase